MSAVERWKSMSAGVLQQSVGDDRVAGGVFQLFIKDVARRHLLVAAAGFLPASSGGFFHSSCLLCTMFNVL